jgi:hypothetical protein
MEWLQNNWFWIVLVVGFVGIHMFGHGGHQHGHHGHKRDDWRDPTPNNDTTAEKGDGLTELNGPPSTDERSKIPTVLPLATKSTQAVGTVDTDGKRHRNGC